MKFLKPVLVKELGTIKKFHILGTGPSWGNYTPDGNPLITVNDGCKLHPADYVVCVDKPSRFTTDRLDVIRNCEPKAFFTHLYEEWATLRNNVVGFHLGGVRGDPSTIDEEAIVYSNNSTYAATVIAYKLGADEIVLHGVDIKGHEHLNRPELYAIVMGDFRKLYNALKSRGVKVFVSSSYSALNEFIPLEPTPSNERQ